MFIDIATANVKTAMAPVFDIVGRPILAAVALSGDPFGRRQANLFFAGRSGNVRLADGDGIVARRRSDAGVARVSVRFEQRDGADGALIQWERQH